MDEDKRNAFYKTLSTMTSFDTSVYDDLMYLYEIIGNDHLLLLRGIIYDFAVWLESGKLVPEERPDLKPLGKQILIELDMRYEEVVRYRKISSLIDIIETLK